MIDVSNAEYLNLKPVSDNHYYELVSPLFAPGEHVIASYQTDQIGAVFTNKRIFGLNTMDETDKYKDITSIPYKKIQAFSIKTAVDSKTCELELWVSGLIKIKMEFLDNEKITDICAAISAMSLT